MDLVVTIPTYWSRPDGWRPGDLVFDHPTPVGEQGTLGRALASLACLTDQSFELVVVVAPTCDEIADAACAQVSEIVAAAPKAARLFTPQIAGRLSRALSHRGQASLAPLVSLAGYSQVRNACLVAGRLLEADAVVMIDDDEVFEDPAFLDEARAGLARGFLGLAGYYVDEHGSYQLSGTPPAWEAPWGKRAAMARAFDDIIGEPPRYRETPFVFGGNMIITRHLLERVPFDPGVPRGEDIDYLINARLEGFSFTLDDQLAITHLPPPHTHPAWQQLRQDGLRFAYERDKIAGSGLDPAALDPYPGPFLSAELNPRFASTCTALAEHYEREGDSAGAAATRDAAVQVASATFPDAHSEFMTTCGRWRALMTTLRDLGGVPGGWDPVRR